MSKINFIQAADGKTLDLYIYDAVTGDGFDWWTWEMVKSETSANYFREQLAKHPNIAQINVYINSPGGSVMEGYGIYSQLKRHPAHVTAYVDGFACSIASVIAMAADNVIMYSNAMMMIHNMADCVYGNSAQLRKAADDLDKIMIGNRQTYLDKAAGKLDEARLTELLNAESWLTAQECLDLGLCDEISGQHIDAAKTTEIMKQMTVGTQQQVSAFKAMQKALTDMMQNEPPPKNPQPKPPAQPNENHPNKTQQFFLGLLK